MHVLCLERTVRKGKYWYWPRREKFECTSMYLPYCTSYSAVYPHFCKCWRIIISLHAFSGCWQWKSMRGCSACVVLLCFLLSSLCVNLCRVAYGCAVQESCICILTSVVGSLGQDWQHWSLAGQYGPQKEVFCGVEAWCWNLSLSLRIMNSWLVACHSLQDGFGQITLLFYNDDDLHTFLWQRVVVIVVLIPSECYPASTKEILPPPPCNL